MLIKHAYTRFLLKEINTQEKRGEKKKMEWIGILIGEIVITIILGILFRTNTKTIKKIVENKELDKIANQFPENKAICQSILKMLGNEKVNVKENENPESQASLYIAATDTIWIANIKASYTRIQTIAHECLHSIQNRRMLLFNFLYSNIYLLYFILSIILTMLGVFQNYYLQLMILIGLSFIYYMVRSYLETDAMTKAKFVAHAYMIAYTKQNAHITNEQIEKMIEAYGKMNEIGIPTTMFLLFFNSIAKVGIYTILAMVLTLFF